MKWECLWLNLIGKTRSWVGLLRGLNISFREGFTLVVYYAHAQLWFFYYVKACWHKRKFKIIPCHQCPSSSACLSFQYMHMCTNKVGHIRKQSRWQSNLRWPTANLCTSSVSKRKPTCIPWRFDGNSNFVLEKLSQILSLWGLNENVYFVDHRTVLQSVRFFSWHVIGPCIPRFQEFTQKKLRDRGANGSYWKDPFFSSS